MPKKHMHRKRPAESRVGIQARQVEMYPVYAREDVLGQTPLFFVTAAQRREWMEQGAVESISRGKALRLRLNLPPKTQKSITMGPSVIEGAAAGKAFARSCVDAWRPQFVVTMVVSLEQAPQCVLTGELEQMAAVMMRAAQGEAADGLDELDELRELRELRELAA